MDESELKRESERNEVERLLEEGNSMLEAVRKVARKSDRSAETIRRDFYNNHENRRGQPGKKLSDEDERLLLLLVVAFSENNQGLSMQDIIRVVKNTFDLDVSQTWVYRFRIRHKDKLSKRKPMVVSKARNKITDDSLIYQYVNSMLRMHAITSFKAHQIVNYDESRLYVGPDSIKCTFITEASWKMKAQKVVDTGGHQTGSVLPFISADGKLLFMAIVTKPLGERSKISISRQLDNNSRSLVPHKIYFTDTSFVDSALFDTILNDFATMWKNQNPGLDCMVIGDNLGVHEDLDLRARMVKEGLYMVFLPPNTTHWSQPLDTILFALFKVAARKIITNRNFNNMLADFKLYLSFVEVALTAAKEAFTPQAIRAAYREAGVFPLDADKILAKVGTLWNERKKTPRDPLQDKVTKAVENLVTAANRSNTQSRRKQMVVKANVYNRRQGRTTSELILESKEEEIAKLRVKKEKQEERARKEAERKKIKEEKEAAKVERALKKKKKREENALKRKRQEEERKLRTCCITRCIRRHRAGGGAGWTGCEYCDFFWMCKPCSADLDNQKRLQLHEKRCPHKPLLKRRKK